MYVSFSTRFLILRCKNTKKVWHRQPFSLFFVSLHPNSSVTTVSTEGRIIAVNGNFLAMAWNIEGEIVVVDSKKPFELNADQPRIKGHNANILD